MNKTKILSDDEIGRWLVDFTKTRNTDGVNKYELMVMYGGKLAGTLYLSVKYESVLKKDWTPSQKETAQDDDIPPELLLNFANNEQNFEAYSPEESKDDSFEVIDKIESQSKNKNINDDIGKLNRAYHKRFLYFVPKSYKIYEFDEESKSFYDISTQTDILHPSEVQTTELPDGSYLLTGGRDATTK